MIIKNKPIKWEKSQVVEHFWDWIIGDWPDEVFCEKVEDMIQDGVNPSLEQMRRYNSIKNNNQI